MANDVLRTGFVALMLLIIGPASTHAQSQCETYYCTASAIYSGGSINGYVTYFDFNIGLYMNVTANVYTADNYSIPMDSQYGWDSITARVDGFGPTLNGWYMVFGLCQYENSWGWNDDGVAYQNYDLIYVPTGETIGWDSPSGGGIGEVFINYLQPSYYNFDGYTMSESFSGVPNDTCFPAYKIDNASSHEIYAPAAESGTVMFGNYTDDVWADPGWVNFYKNRVPAGASCSESINEFVSYAGNSYEVISIGVNVLPNDYSTFRGGCTVSSGGTACQ